MFVDVIVFVIHDAC